MVGCDKVLVGCESVKGSVIKHVKRGVESLGSSQGLVGCGWYGVVSEVEVKGWSS